MKSLLRRLNQTMSGRLGVRLMRDAELYPWQREDRRLGAMADSGMPADAAAWLRPDHARLIELQQRYRAFDPQVTTPWRWTESRLPPEDLLHFRGDNAFVWQMRRLNQNPLTYALCYYAVKAGDAEGLLDRLDEDGAFGAHHFTIDDRLVSRDLIDSVREIQFLIRHAGLGERSRNILDIGAGYGRLAYRLDQAMGDRLRTFTTDAFAPSTFVSEYYLRHRQAASATVVPLDEVEALLAGTQIDLATNIHSFSECAMEAIAWWVERLARHKVRHLMIVPNEGSSGGARCERGDGKDFEPILAGFGYRALVREPRYPDPIVQQYGIDPVHLHLFELEG